MDATPQEARLAKSAYDWLRLSPFATILTLFLVAYFGPGTAICSQPFLSCESDSENYLNFGIAVLVSGLWHLTLLRYANNKNSEFVRRHGQRALTQAGIRTGVALTGVGLDWFLNAGGGFVCVTIVVLFVIWAVNLTSYKKWVEGNAPEHESPENIGATPQLRPTSEMLAQVFTDLNSEDDVAILAAIERLENFTESGEDILKRLEELADESDNMDIRTHARAALNRSRKAKPSFRAISQEEAMSDNDSSRPEEILNEIYRNLQSGDDVVVLQTIAELKNLNYSSEAVRRQLEQLAAQSGNKDIRADALAALDSAANRAVQKRFNANRLDRGVRHTLLNEINEWEKSSLLSKQNADVIRRRYDFDFAPPPAPKPAPVQSAVPSPQAEPPKPAPAAAQPPPAAQPSAPPEPRPTLLQTLTSEASIKIYLYLGAFFVIAAASILGAVVEELRLPILIIGTLIFGAIAVLVKKRLPQPSFALFIVFSFLLPITANSLHETLRQSFDLSAAFTNGYWALVYFFMAAIWSGSTRLYESRFFSAAAFAALTLSFFNIGLAFEAETAVHTLLMGIAALAGLTGTWLLKKWKDAKFAFPLFLAAQILQAANLAVSLGAFGFNSFDASFNNLVHLSAFVTWALGMVFYIASDGLYPFFAFPWLAAAALIPMPWFVIAAFELESPGSTILLFAWSAVFTATSEALFRFQRTQRYSLPALLATMPNFALALFTGFVHEIWLGVVVATGAAIFFTALHVLRSRWWLWTLALLNGIIAYFSFFELEFVHRLGVHFAYELVGVTILLLIPDLLMKKDWMEKPAWRLPLRVYGAVFLVITSLSLLFENRPGHVAVSYFILAVFCAAYALAYRNPYLGYIPSAFLSLAIVFALDSFDLDAWLPSLSALAILYYAAGALLRNNQKWADMLRQSGMALGVILSAAALVQGKETGGWYTVFMGLLFLAEMRARKNGWFEIGAPILFTSGAFLILRDFDVDRSAYHLLTYSLIWVFTDLLDHLTFRQPRPINMIIRGVGALLAGVNIILLLGNSDPRDAAVCYGIYTLTFTLCALVYRHAWLGYIPAATLPLTIFFALDYFKVDAWLPSLTGLAVLYFLAGLAIRAKAEWSFMLRNSALVLGSVVSIASLIALKETGGWYALVTGALFIAEMALRKNGWFEPGAPVLFTMGVFLILNDFDVERITYHLLAYSLIWLLADLSAHLAFPNPRPLKWLIRFAGGMTALVNYGYLFLETDAAVGAIGFAVYSLLFLAVGLFYRQPNLLYTFTLTLPLFAAFLFRAFDVTQWIHPVIGVAVLYYAAGYSLRARSRWQGWEQPLLYSGLGLGVVVSFAAPILGGLDASIPVATAATLWAVEAYAKRNAWLAFPANVLYLVSYFIILFELDVNEAQFFSVGTALFGLIQHYLLTRAKSRTGAFIMGMFSQFVLLGTTYIEMINKDDLGYFFLLFLQSLVVLVYGIVIRSRSLTFFPIGFSALGVITVVYSALKDIGTIFVIGCTGIVLLMLGVIAVLLRERIAKLGERLSDWGA